MGQSKFNSGVSSDRRKVEAFYQVQFFFKELSSKKITYYRFLINAVSNGVVNLNLNIRENYYTFTERATSEMKKCQLYGLAIKEFEDILAKLPREKMVNFLSKNIIDLILECEMVPYEQVDITRMYFNNTHMTEEDKKRFLHEQIEKFNNGNKDLRVINSLDKIKYDPNFFRQDMMYENFIERLIDDYLVDFNKYLDLDKTKKEYAKKVIRMIYRHQNKGYYDPALEYKGKIANAYAFNCWFKELEHMVSKNTLGINKENYEYIIDEINDGFIDAVLVGELSEEKAKELQSKFDKIYKIITEVVEDPLKLVRKEEQ